MALTGRPAGAAALVGAGLGTIEFGCRRRPGHAVTARNQGWVVGRPATEHLQVSGSIVVDAGDVRRALVVRDVRARVRLLSTGAVDGLHVDARTRSPDRAPPARPDGYWRTCVVAPAGSGGPRAAVFELEVEVDVRGGGAALDGVYAVHLALAVDADGAAGPRRHIHHVMAAVGRPDPADGPDWRAGGEEDTLVRPLRTHLLGPMDDPVEVVSRYAIPHARAGDMVVVGESPLAVMQGRFVDPTNLRPSWVASRFALFMSGEGSVGTAPGMQAVVDEVGALRVLGALTGGLVAKLAGRDGWFYRLAGTPSRLVDDVTGTLPPYDRLIVLGPERSDEVCRAVRSATGLETAVVDANDLGAVDVIGSTDGVDRALVARALRANPAGNASETTPLVLIRPA